MASRYRKMFEAIQKAEMDGFDPYSQDLHSVVGKYLNLETPNKIMGDPTAPNQPANTTQTVKQTEQQNVQQNNVVTDTKPIVNNVVNNPNKYQTVQQNKQQIVQQNQPANTQTTTEENTATQPKEYKFYDTPAPNEKAVAGSKYLQDENYLGDVERSFGSMDIMPKLVANTFPYDPKVYEYLDKTNKNPNWTNINNKERQAQIKRIDQVSKYIDNYYKQLPQIGKTYAETKKLMANMTPAQKEAEYQKLNRRMPTIENLDQAIIAGSIDANGKPKYTIEEAKKIADQYKQYLANDFYHKLQRGQSISDLVGANEAQNFNKQMTLEEVKQAINNLKIGTRFAGITNTTAEPSIYKGNPNDVGRQPASTTNVGVSRTFKEP